MEIQYHCEIPSLMFKAMHTPFWTSQESQIPHHRGPISLTIGNFDGVHLGHQELVKRSVAWAHKNKGLSLVLTFHPHPVTVLFPERKHSRLFDLEDLKDKLFALGVDGVFLQPFSRDFSELGADSFMKNFLQKVFQPKHIIVGSDFSFGQSRTGDVKDLAEFSQQHGIEFEELPQVIKNSVRISTSLIRQSLNEGQIEVAAELLGRKFYLRGLVVRGEQRGRLLGFPTANIKPTVDFFPKMGVYATKTVLRGKTFYSVTNIGINKTFFEGTNLPVKIETHILNFSDQIYGEEIRVEFCRYVREEMRFSGIDQLKAQIALDIKNVASGFDE